ncbi:hypothetical protein Nepgr_020118 [Nepenthes gracilis]|uniref:Uncharacterized protein n=1 Tax=Nepenthes gracilis TaxID=150966 RepID=A0AAD3SWG6_NEPGR|nr:hypothetical protein Nepgr_020118 [Nepenthes gracilis]
MFLPESLGGEREVVWMGSLPVVLTPGLMEGWPPSDQGLSLWPLLSSSFLEVFCCFALRFSPVLLLLLCLDDEPLNVEVVIFLYNNYQPKLLCLDDDHS